jgi:hypothetical protein
MNISHSYSGGYEEFYLLGYNAVYSAESHPTACYLFHAGLLLSLFFETEDEGDMYVRNGWLSKDCMTLYLRRHNSFVHSY